MRSAVLALTLLMLIVASPCLAIEAQKPEAIADKMAFKFARGITNVATAIVEIPKQSYLTVRDRGGVGYVVGPLKGLGMTFYRGLVGVAETVFFMVPQPGYYDPMIDPDYVWKGWEDRRAEPLKDVTEKGE
ncbi:exosortase system-associated protein, TIGR04073 family [Geobacter argillaceus]|uniref:Putative exosortase-associated protein (TIGR04073 family) n=1 Tax=Geobacter argillaceus TaxID=345631 RepID=A0A562VI48_9BACT|nr:exosortase system-associated protein, TIGR04073 family [Geobacter argillaceus]TWJ17595.1 putative exosortase-associated protein (TIGR04073 family) [Geobacter argillaceus]